MKLLTRIALISTLGLSVSCAPDPQDMGSNELLVNISGVVLDGYLTNATVYIDSNQNYKVDAWEPRSSTDNNGQFTLQYVNTNNPVIRVFGGYDQNTARSFKGSMSAELDGSSQVVISPLSSVLQGMSSADQSTLATNLGVTLAEMRADYMDFSDTSLDANRDVLVGNAMKVHKMVEILARNFDDHYTAFGSDESLPDSTAGLVYDAMVTYLANNGLDLDAFCATGTISAWITAAETNVRNYMTAKSVALPGLFSGTDATAIDVQGDALCTAIDALLVALGADATTTPKIQRGVQVVSMKMQANPLDASLGDAITLLDSATYTGYIPSFSDGYDLSLVSTNITGLGGVLGDGTGALTGAALASFPDLGMMRFDGATVNANSASGDVGGVVLFFHGDSATATSGDLTMCISYTQQTGTGSTYNTTGTRFTGTWNRLDDYNIVLDVNVLLFSESFLLRSTGGGAGTPRVFLLDFNDNTANWESTVNMPDDFTDYVTAPSDDTACAGVL